MRMKWFLAALLTFSFLLLNMGSVLAGENKSAFTDIKGSYAEESINNLAVKGIICGIDNKQFLPEKTISRLHFSILIAKVLGVQPFYPTKPSFTDISQETLEGGYVEALAYLGLINGMGGKNFNGNMPVLRQDAAVIISNALGKVQQIDDVRGKYADADKISPYAVDSVFNLTAKGWMNGSEGKFHPLKYLTRAEAAILADFLLRARDEQAHTALDNPVQQLTLKTGEVRPVEHKTIISPVPFTLVYGVERPKICSVLSNGAVVAGEEPGTNIITVNSGHKSYPVRINVVSSAISRSSIISSDTRLEEDLNGSYKVVEKLPDPAFKHTEYKSYSGPVEGLFSKSEAWTGFLRQQARDIIIDLEKLSTVSTISIEFKQDAASGIYLPKYLKSSVSADGVSWYRLGEVINEIPQSDTRIQDVTMSLKFAPVTTRYIKLSFPVDVWVFARHLSIKGGLPAEKPVVLAPDEQINMGVSIEAAGNLLKDPDIKDILLVYTGGGSKQYILDKKDFVPLVAYVNRWGEIEGRMFDTILFMPYTNMPCTSSAWDTYLEDLFSPGKQLYALEEAMAKVNEATGWQEKEKVILTLPYPDSKQTEFGAIEPEQEPLSFSEENTSREKALENRREAVQWYYDRMMLKWNAADFKHLELAGMYWYKESIDQSNCDEELVKKVASMVRGNGHNFFWIPFYGAKGLNNWKSYGFSHVLLQPNYYATQAPPEERMNWAALLARQYGTGIEIEFDSRILTTRYYYDLFYKEIEKACKLGLDDAANAYYTGLKNTILDAVYSDIPEIRKIYDDIYRWVNGTCETE